MSNTNSQSMTVYTGTFVTQRGEQRTMNFIRMNEAPSGTFPGNLRERKLRSGFETVWDIDRQAYRTFNNNTVIGSVQASTRNVSVNLF